MYFRKGKAMFRTILHATTFTIGFSTLAATANAATMTFTNVNLDPLANTYSEDGILVSGNGDLGIGAGSALHFDDGGTSSPSTVAFSMATHFNAVSFLPDPVNFDFLVRLDDGSYLQPTYLNALVQGFRGAALVSNRTFDMGAAPDAFTVNLGTMFNNLTSLVIGILLPDFAAYQAMPGVARAETCAPCSHFNVDNVTLAPVPLPAGLPLAASGLALLALISRRRRAT